jgi:N-methylhydantoinase A/oxoprolinase/acetone carboxylase beta subunit
VRPAAAKGKARLLGIDTGGTYTDAVLFDDRSGVLRAAKALTTKHDLAIGVRRAIDQVLPSTGDPAEKDAEISLVSISTTLATNALVEGLGSPICLIAIGFGEAALQRAGLSEALAGDPVVFIDGGHGASGDPQGPLDTAAARQAILAQAPRAAAFAVAGYFAVRNPAHEIAVRDLVHELTALPVTCSHELTSNLDAPRRAMTTVLNARLIGLLQDLILAVRDLLTERGIQAPLMVVKGDGSLISAETALNRPIETILSGPAASVVGARHLAGEDDVVVSDIGGTTTDIAILRDGMPVLDRDGAKVGGWRTMVEAIAVHTVGLGGDSELRHTADAGLRLGPRRALPLSLLGQEQPAILPVLRAQLAAESLDPWAGRFAVRIRALDTQASHLSAAELEIWELLADGPLTLAGYVTKLLRERALARLVNRGLIIFAGFTPSDAAHVLGRQATWSVEAARLGAEIWLRRLSGETAGGPPEDAESFAEKVVERLTIETGKALVAAVLGNKMPPPLERGHPLGHWLIEQALARPSTAGSDLLAMALSLKRPLVAIGAPAATYYPAVAERLDTRLVVPDHAGVCNAVGAVASGVMQRVTALITAPNDGCFRVHLPSGIRDFEALDSAADHAAGAARHLAETEARAAGAEGIDVTVERADRWAPSGGGDRTFIESQIVATAAGRPAMRTL